MCWQQQATPRVATVPLPKSHSACFLADILQIHSGFDTCAAPSGTTHRCPDIYRTCLQRELLFFTTVILDVKNALIRQDILYLLGEGCVDMLCSLNLWRPIHQLTWCAAKGMPLCVVSFSLGVESSFLLNDNMTWKSTKRLCGGHPLYMQRTEHLAFASSLSW